MCIKPKNLSSLSIRKCSRIKRSIMRKIIYEDCVNDVGYEDENVDGYDGIVIVFVMVVVVIEVTMLPTWRQ